VTNILDADLVDRDSPGIGTALNVGDDVGVFMCQFGGFHRYSSGQSCFTKAGEQAYRSAGCLPTRPKGYLMRLVLAP